MLKVNFNELNYRMDKHGGNFPVGMGMDEKPISLTRPLYISVLKSADIWSSSNLKVKPLQSF